MGFDDTYWQYKGLVEFMSDNPGMYTLDNQRTELHKELEKHFEGKEAELKEVLHNLERDMQPSDLTWAVNNIDKFREDAKREGRHYAP